MIRTPLDSPVGSPEGLVRPDEVVPPLDGSPLLDVGVEKVARAELVDAVV